MKVKALIDIDIDDKDPTLCGSACEGCGTACYSVHTYKGNNEFERTQRCIKAVQDARELENQAQRGRR